MRRIVLSCLMLAVLSPSFAQVSILKGKVNNKSTGEPIAGANVFFANTHMGVASSEDGTYITGGVNNGKYDLVASFVGFETFSTSLELTDSIQYFDIYLEEKTTLLQTITVQADTVNWFQNFCMFKKYFLGETENAKKCVIKNPHDILLYYDEENATLIGYARKTD